MLNSFNFHATQFLPAFQFQNRQTHKQSRDDITTPNFLYKKHRQKSPAICALTPLLYLSTHRHFFFLYFIAKSRITLYIIYNMRQYYSNNVKMPDDKQQPNKSEEVVFLLLMKTLQKNYPVKVKALL